MVTIELIDGTFIHLISEFSQTICGSLKVSVRSERASEVFRSTTNTLSVSLSKSVQFIHLNRELHTRNWRNLMRKSHIKSSHVKLKCLIRIQFLWRKDHIYTRNFCKQTSKPSRLQSKKCEFTNNYFPCHLLTEQR